MTFSSRDRRSMLTIAAGLSRTQRSRWRCGRRVVRVAAWERMGGPQSDDSRARELVAKHCGVWKANESSCP